MASKKRSRKDDAEEGAPASKRMAIDATTKWFWVADEHSYTLAELRAHLATWPPEPKWQTGVPFAAQRKVTTPSGRPVDYAWIVEDAVRRMERGEKETSESVIFIVDRARTAGDAHCSLSFLDWPEADPVLLNLTGRTYDRATIVKAIEATLEQGLPLRLEEGAIEPEQLTSIRLYPNRSLGAKADAQRVSYEEKTAPIAAFDANIALRELPDFWADVRVLDGNGLWGISRAAEKAGFGPRDRPVIKNLLCVAMRFPVDHPKHPAVFRNCLFRRCEIDMRCWCGPVLHGCRFEDCTFINMDDLGWAQPTKCHRCEIAGSTIVEGKKPQDNGLPYVAWLRRYVGRESLRGRWAFRLLIEPDKKEKKT